MVKYENANIKNAYVNLKKLIDGEFNIVNPKNIFRTL